MRILMLDNELPPLGGGMGTANLALLHQFAKCKDLEIDLITSSLGRHWEFEQFSDKIRIIKVPVWNKNIHHSSNRELIFYFVQTLIHAMRLLRKNSYDFCFAWSTLPAGAVAYVLCIVYKLPYMVWVSGPDIPGFETRYEKIYQLTMPLIKKIWQLSDPLIAKCIEEVDMIHKQVHDLPVTIIPNGVDVDIFKPSNKRERMDAINIVCVARLIERKGQRQLIAALKALVDEGNHFCLNLVGTGDSLAQYQALVNQLHLEKCVTFSGYVSRVDIPAKLSASDIFVLPSYNEGMALAALEAMACGLPVILTETGGTNTLLKEGINGYKYSWGDVSALTEHLRKFALHPELINSMGQASREIAMEYSWDNLSVEYLDLFNQHVTN